MKTNNLVKKIIAIVFSALMIIPTFVGWIYGSFSTKIGSLENKSTDYIKFGDITENVVEYSESGAFINLSKVLFWIAFAVAMVLIVLLICQILLPKVKVLGLLVKVAGIALIASAVASFVCATIWCIANGSSTEYTKVTYLPIWGSAITLVAGLVAGILALSKNKK